MSATVCPSPETLLQYSLGMLPEEQRDALDRHLDGCPDCQATIVTLDDGGDTVIGRLRMPPGDESLLSEPQLQDALAAALAMPAPLPTGDMPQMLGEYRLLEELGRGGMGRVFKALHTKLDRVVAVKVLSRGRVGDPQALVRFEREMKAVGRLAHPNIVQAHDAREIDQTPVLIMEFVDGLDLAELVRRSGPLAVAAACELIRQTALALQCADEHGLVHRDVKPSNIMLARSAEVKLLDLGLARFHAEGAAAGEEMTGTGQAMGTADYMAPEQASDSRSVDIRADLYSLGCTLYKLLSGRAPFGGPEHHGTLDKLNAHVQQQPPLIRRLVPDVPEGLAAILDRLLAKDPADRFATPAEVADALAPWCVGADLPALLRQALEARVSLLPSGEGRGEGRPAVSASPAARPPLFLTSWGWKWLAGQLLLLLLVGCLGFALGITIRIQKDGHSYDIQPPEGSRTVIDSSGNATVTISGKAAAAKTPAVSAAAELKALLGQWKVVRVEKGKDADAAWGAILGAEADLTSTDRFDFLRSPADGDVRFRLFRPRPVGRGSADQAGAALGWTGEMDGFEGVAKRFTYRIDPTAAPKTFDLLSYIPSDTANEGLEALGIYEIEGDKLKICLAQHLSSIKSDQRPKSFAIAPDSGDILFVLERYRPSEDEKAIEGNWSVVSQTDDGKPVPPEQLGESWMTDGGHMVDGKQLVRNIRGYYFHDGSTIAPFHEGPYDLDATKTPKQMTACWRDTFNGTMMSANILGIYKFDGGRLTIAYRTDGPRPATFESRPGSGVTLLVLKRGEPPRPETGPGGPKSPGGMGGGGMF